MQERKGNGKWIYCPTPARIPLKVVLKKIKKSDFALFLVFRRRLSFLLKCLWVVYFNGHERVLVSF